MMNPAVSTDRPRPPDEGDESFSRIVSPLLAGFSLPTIVGLVTTPTSHPLANDIVLSCLVASTGLFLASFQLSIGSVYKRYHHSFGSLRAGLSFAGIILLIVALTELIAAVAKHWWVTVPLVVLCIGGVAPILLRWWLKLHPNSDSGDHEQSH